MAEPATAAAPSPQPTETAEREESGFFPSYAEFAKTLRTWFVAYGIGGPILLVTRPELTTKVVQAGKAAAIGRLFLMGVALQIAQALIYKTCMWYLYLAELKPALKKTSRYKTSKYISEAFWIELLCDLGTVAAFGLATWMLFRILTPP